MGCRPGTKTHNVYFGAGPDDLKLIGKVERVGVKLSQMKCNARYYLRVDEVQADGSIVRGTVRSFTTGGLAGWWKLDETEGTKAADSSGNHHDGLIHGNPAWRPRGGKIAGGLQFDGVQDFVDTGWTADLATWTVAVWVKSPSSPASAPVPSGPVDRQANFQINWNHRRSEFRAAPRLCASETPGTARASAAWTRARGTIWPRRSMARPQGVQGRRFDFGESPCFGMSGPRTRDAEAGPKRR